MLVCEVWIYSVVLGIWCFTMGWVGFSFNTLIKVFFPITYNEYPFFSAYIILFFLIPFINKMLYAIKRDVSFLIVLLFLVVSVIPTFSNSSWIMTETQLPAFIFLYIVGASIGKYENKPIFNHKKHALLGFLVMVLLMMISEIVLKLVNSKNSFYFVWDMNKTPAILAAVLIFIFFKDWQLARGSWKSKNIISCFAGSVFGVYLIHMNRNFKTVLLDVWFDNTMTYGTWKLLPQILVGAVLIFLGCVAVDITCSKIVEKVFERPVDWISAKIEKTIARIKAKGNS